MKKSFFYLLTITICFASCDSNNPDTNNYVDLGLSSGVYWQFGDEPGMYTFDDAVSIYGEHLPTITLYQELLQECKWTYKSGYGYIVTGPNGKTIEFHFNGTDGTGSGASGVGQLGMYWTSKRDDFLSSYSLTMDFSGVSIQSFFSNMKESVKLVKQPWEIEKEEEEEQTNPEEGENGEAVDLGLPSQTEWYPGNMHTGNDYYFTVSEASQYKSQMPTAAEWQELMNNCTWTWNGNGYIITGTNGKYIILPAAGYQINSYIQGENQVGYYLVNDDENTLLCIAADGIFFTKASYMGENSRFSLRFVTHGGGGWNWPDPQPSPSYCWRIISYESGCNVIGYEWATEQAIASECESLSAYYGNHIAYEKTDDTDQISCVENNNPTQPQDPEPNPYSNEWDNSRDPNPNIIASYNASTQTLTISGYGEMYNDDISSLWKEYSDVKHVIIEDGITTIAHHAFKDLQVLQTIVIPSSVTKIGEWAFERCYQLQNVTLSANIQYIRNHAFKDCSSLQFIKIYATTPPTIESDDAFMSYHYSSTPVRVPQSSYSAYKKNYYWAKFNNIETF